MQSGDTHPMIDDVLLDVMQCGGRKLVFDVGQERAPPGNMLIPGNTTTERIPCSMHGVPERRSNERGGWGGVTPCVVSPPHRLPTKRATLTPKYDRLLAPRGCHGERHHWPVRLDEFPFFWELCVDTCMRWHFHVSCWFSATFQKQNSYKICCLNFRLKSFTPKWEQPFRNKISATTWLTEQHWNGVDCTGGLVVETWAVTNHSSWRPSLHIMPLALPPSFPVCVSTVTIK